MVKTLHFQYRGYSFNPWLGNKDLTCCVVSQKLIFKKLKKKSFKAVRTARKNGLTPRVYDLVHRECGWFRAGICGVYGVFRAPGHQAAVGQVDTGIAPEWIPPGFCTLSFTLVLPWYGCHILGHWPKQVTQHRASLSLVICHKVSLGEEFHHLLLCVRDIICAWWLEGKVDIPIIHYLLHTQLVLSGKSTSSAGLIIPSSETAEANKKLHDHSGCHTKRDAVPRGMFHWAAQASGQKGSYWFTEGGIQVSCTLRRHTELCAQTRCSRSAQRPVPPAAATVAAPANL